MAPGRKNFQRVQWAKETTPGTAITTATQLWRGTGGVWADDREITEVEELTGYFGGIDRTYNPKLLASMSLNQCEANYEQLPWLFAAALGGAITGSADGTGSSGYSYLTAMPTTNSPTNHAFTIQTGDDAEAERSAYCKCTKIELSGMAGEALKVSSTWMGQEVKRMDGATPGAFEPNPLTIQTVEDIMVSKGKVYIDAISGTAGTTQVTNKVLGFKLTFEATWEPKFTMDGNLYFGFAVFTGYKVTGELTYEHDSASGVPIVGATSEKAYWRSQTPRLLQIKFEGNTYATPGTGTTYGKKTLRFNLPIKYQKFAPLSDKNGNDIVVATFRSRFNSTYGDAGTVLIANEVASLA